MWKIFGWLFADTKSLTPRSFPLVVYVRIGLIASMNLNQTQVESPTEGQSQSDFSDSSFRQEDLEDAIISHSQTFMNQLELHEPIQYQYNVEDNQEDVSDEADSDDLSNALRLATLTDTVPVAPVSSAGPSPGSAASGSPHSPRSGATPLTPPDPHLSPIRDKLNMAITDVATMSQNGLEDDSQPTPRSQQFPTDSFPVENVGYHEVNMVDHPPIQSYTIDDTRSIIQPENPSSTGQPTPTHPSLLQKVLSKTRPSYLPPKPKTEDLKHIKEWEEMMQRSRTAGMRPE